jgi:hypothetical protein
MLGTPACVRGVKLDIRVPHDNKTEMTLGPHCQCSTHEQFKTPRVSFKLKANNKKKPAHAGSSSDALGGSMFMDTPPLYPRSIVKVSSPTIYENCRFRVPSYAMGPSSETMKRQRECTKAWLRRKAPADVLPRWVTYIRPTTNKLKAVDLTSMYRNQRRKEEEGHVSRCQVPVQIYLVHESMHLVLPGILAFLRGCGKELAEFFGNVGTNSDMHRLTEPDY